MPLGGPKLTQNFGYEVDFSGGWNGQLRNFSFNADATFVGVTPLLKYGGDVLQLSMTASRDLKVGRGQTITPYFWVAHAMPTTSNSPEQGTFYHEGLRWNWSRGSWSAGANAELMYDSGAFGFESGHLARGGASVGRKFGPRLSLKIPVTWSTLISKVGDGRRSEIQVGASVVIH